MAKPVLARIAAQNQGLKWCWVHQKYEEVYKFGKAKGRPDGLQPLCREARCEQDRAKRSKSPTYKPSVTAQQKESAPSGFKWCAHHSAYCKVEDFGKDDRKIGGLQSSCRRGQQEKIPRITNRTSKYNPAPHGMRWCGFHQCFELLSEFADRPITKRDKSGKAARCRMGDREYQKPRSIVFQKANPDYVRRRSSIRRGRKRDAEGSHTVEEIQALLVRQKFLCAACRISLKKKRHLDHIIPLAKGGSNYISNLQWLCPTCNCSKHAKDPIEWAQESGRLL